MKKYIFIFTLLLTVFLIGCDSDNTTNPIETVTTQLQTSTETTITTTQTEVVTYDISWFDENGTSLEVTTVSENDTVMYTYEPTDTAE